MNIKDNFEDADAFYARLVAIHESLDDAQSERFNLALILFLANHIGEAATLDGYLERALESLRDGDGDGDGDRDGGSAGDAQPTAGTSP